jgi:hypothetical protein
MAKTPFDHINAICKNQRVDYFDSLDDVDKKTFNVYVINMGLSMNPDFLPYVNEVNKHWNEMGPREAYLFYSQLIPQGNYYNKWIRGKKEAKFESWLVEMIAKHFEVSKAESINYLESFYQTDEGREELKTILQGYGLDAKKLKKVKL